MKCYVLEYIYVRLALIILNIFYQDATKWLHQLQDRLAAQTPAFMSTEDLQQLLAEKVLVPGGALPLVEVRVC